MRLDNAASRHSAFPARSTGSEHELNATLQPLPVAQRARRGAAFYCSAHHRPTPTPAILSP